MQRLESQIEFAPNTRKRKRRLSESDAADGIETERPEAKEIADSLTRNVKVWFDAWEMRPGQSLIDKISDGISKSSYLFALLSERSCASN